MELKYIIFGILILSILPLTSAGTLDIGYNISFHGIELYIDTIPIEVDQAIWNNTGCENTICLYNASWQNGNLIVNHTGLINWTSGAIKSSQFPRISATNIDGVQTIETLASSLVRTYNFTLYRSSVDCTRIGKIDYSTTSGNYSKTYDYVAYTCANNVLSLGELPVENGDNRLVLYDNRDIQGICASGTSSFAESVGLVGLILTIILVGATLSLLFLSMKGYIDIGINVNELSWGQLITGVFVVGITMLLIATIIFIFSGAYCPAIGG